MGFKLRIFDGERQTVHVQTVETASVTIGRGETCDVVLPSPYVSREQAVLRHLDERYVLESVGRNPSFVNGREVEPGEKIEIQPDEEIRIAEYSLFIEAPRARADEALDAARVLAEIELELHARLLESVDVRASRLEEDGGESQKLRSTLEDLVRERVPDEGGGIPSEVMEHALRECLYSEIVQEILARAATSHEEKAGAGFAGKLDAMLSRVVGEFCTRLGVEGGKEAVRKDLRRLDAGFPDVFREFFAGAEPPLRALIVRRFLTREIMNLVCGFGPLQDLLELPNTSEIMVVHKDLIYIEREGTLERLHRTFITDEILLSVIQRIVEPLGRRIDRSTPLVDARLPDGSRVNAIIPPLAVKGPCLTIRRFSKTPLTVDDLVRFGSLTPESVAFLQASVLARRNLIISGGTGSGKTTLLNVLSGFIPQDERIVTIEDSAELQLRQPHVVTLETRPPNVEGKGAYTIRDLVRNALRMRPDRVIVGECRGAEALDMLQAMNTGHDGSLTTIHANSPEDAMLRLETLVLEGVDLPVRAIRSQIDAAIHVIVQVSRLASGKRLVTSIAEVVGMDPEDGRILTNEIFEEQDGRLVHSGYLPTFIDDLVEKGHIDPRRLFAPIPAEEVEA
ncbi:MAG: ATPase, T2SS/T4P/T4SS family [Planctomycetota bacterium]